MSTQTVRDMWRQWIALRSSNTIHRESFLPYELEIPWWYRLDVIVEIATRRKIVRLHNTHTHVDMYETEITARDGKLTEEQMAGLLGVVALNSHLVPHSTGRMLDLDAGN